MKAYCAIRTEPHYRHDAFEKGLQAAGYEVVMRPWQQRDAVEPDDVVLIWNRYHGNDMLADRFEAAGGTVIVAENGYAGMDRSDRRVYAIARGRHNGGGTWHVGANARLPMFASVQPLRRDGEHVLVAPNRSFGTPGNIMPPDWHNDVMRRLRPLTKREIRLRPHPGNKEPTVPLESDLDRCWAVVIWSSSVGVSALIAGIPVICEGAWWICKDAAGAAIEEIERPRIDDAVRRRSLERMAHAQWTVEEIETGAPFVLLGRLSADS